MIKVKVGGSEYLWEETEYGISKDEFFDFIKSFDSEYIVEEVETEEIVDTRAVLVKELKKLKPTDYDTVKELSSVVKKLIELL